VKSQIPPAPARIKETSEQLTAFGSPAQREPKATLAKPAQARRSQVASKSGKFTARKFRQKHC